jgi:regulator of sigma E protease
VTFLIALVAFIFVFGILVFVHELGHYLTARLFKVKVLEFAFGFPPRIWSKKKGETEYSLNAIPIGGYVRLLGEDWHETKDKGNLMNKKPWQKIVILAAGVFFNFILAWLGLTLFYGFGGMPVVPDMWDYNGVTNSLKVYVRDVTAGKTAETAGIKNGDVILSVNGTTVYRHQEVTAALDSAITEEKVTPINYKLMRDGQVIEKTVNTYEDGGVQRIGFGLENKGKIQAKWYLAPVIAVKEMWHISVITLKGLGDFFGTLFTKFKLSKDVGGPVAIFQLSGVAASLGPSIFLQYIVILSISLGVLNIFPFPALDGGHILLVILEKIRGKRISTNVKETVIKYGFGLLLLLVAVITINDLARLGVFKFILGVFKK